MPSKLNLAEMAQGAFMEQFHRELGQVLAKNGLNKEQLRGI